MTAVIDTKKPKPPIFKVISYTTETFGGFNAGCAGSGAASLAYKKPFDWGDCDVFAYNPFELVRMTEFALHGDWELATDKDRKTWDRWMRFGMGQWRTNTVHLTNGEWDMNITYKQFEGRPVASLIQVVETFDFGLLAMGYDLRTGRYIDLRPALFPDDDWDDLPLMLEREMRWSQGLIVPYTALRQGGRYHKYGKTYGYRLSRVKPVLQQGYEIAADYMLNHYDEDKQKLGLIYSDMAQAVATDDWATLAEADTSAPVYRDLDDFLRRID